MQLGCKIMKNTGNRTNIKTTLINKNTYIIFFMLFVLCTLLSSDFLTVMNLRNIALQQAAPVCVSIGMLFVILTGGIDLSVGSVMAFGATLTAILIRDFHFNYIAAILISISAGLLLGSATGFLVAYTKMQGFIASLAVMTITRGLAFVMTNATPIKIEMGTLSSLVNKDMGYPIILITIVIAIFFLLVQKYTSYGRIVIAIGSNVTAVELAGIRVKRYLISVYAISAGLATLAGVFVAARSSTGSATVGMGQELDAITACVIGGASLAGGKGAVVKTVIGALILALIGNIMNLMAVPSYPQDIIKGFIIIAAVLLQIATEKSGKVV